jgi:hypothetical protein
MIFSFKNASGVRVFIMMAAPVPITPVTPWVKGGTEEEDDKGF